MGCDGGSIPKRNELVKKKQKEEVMNSNIKKQANWYTCALSKCPLEQPIVACPLGKLFNKQAILEFLLKTNQYGDGIQVCGYIKSIKLVTTLNMTVNPAYANEGKESNHVFVSSSSTLKSNEAEKKAQFLCPVTMKEMNGTTKFVYISTCGCVFAEQALKEVQSKTCLKCNKLFDMDDIVPLNSEDEKELKRLRERLERIQDDIALQEKKKKEKKMNKRKSEQTIDAIIENTNQILNDMPLHSASKECKKPKRSSESDEEEVQTNGPSTNVFIPNLPSKQYKIKYQSEAIKSLYTRTEADKMKKISNNLFSGTFNRYASYN